MYQTASHREHGVTCLWCDAARSRAALARVIAMCGSIPWYWWRALFAVLHGLMPSVAEPSCCHPSDLSLTGGAGRWTRLPGVHLDASLLATTRSELRVHAEATHPAGDLQELQLRFEGVEDGSALIQQTLTHADPADTMRSDFQPVFWFQEESPTPPQYVDGLSGRRGQTTDAVISASPGMIAQMLGNAEWHVMSTHPGNISVSLSIHGCNCDLEISVNLLPLRSAFVPAVTVSTPDESSTFHSPKFRWQGSFSHLQDGVERLLPPEWMVPQCFRLPNAAAWNPCPLFFAPGSPAIFADLGQLATHPDPDTVHRCTKRFDCPERWRADTTFAGLEAHATTGNRSDNDSRTSTNASDTQTRMPSNTSHEFVVKRHLSFRVDHASECSDHCFDASQWCDDSQCTSEGDDCWANDDEGWHCADGWWPVDQWQENGCAFGRCDLGRYKCCTGRTYTDSQRVVVTLSVQNAQASALNFPPSSGADLASLPDWFECRSAWAECSSASPALSLSNAHDLTVWNAGGRGEGRGFVGNVSDVIRVPRMVLVGTVAALNKVLLNVTFEASRQHAGSNIVRLRVQDEPSRFVYQEYDDVMWQWDALYRSESWQLDACQSFCNADPFCYGIQWLEENAALVSAMQSTLSLLGPLDHQTNSNSQNQSYGPAPFPTCFLFGPTPTTAARPYVSNARAYVRVAVSNPACLGSIECFSDEDMPRASVKHIDVRIVPKANSAPLLSIPHTDRSVQAGARFRFGGISLFDHDLELRTALKVEARCALTVSTRRAGVFHYRGHQALDVMLPLGGGAGEAANPLHLVGSYRAVQSAAAHIYMTVNATTICGGKKCLERDAVEVELDDLGYSGDLGARTQRVTVWLDVRIGPHNRPPALSFSSPTRALALELGRPLLVTGIGIEDHDVCSPRFDRPVGSCGDMEAEITLTTTQNPANNTMASPESTNRSITRSASANLTLLRMGDVGAEVVVKDGGYINSSFVKIRGSLQAMKMVLGVIMIAADDMEPGTGGALRVWVSDLGNTGFADDSGMDQALSASLTLAWFLASPPPQATSGPTPLPPWYVSAATSPSNAPSRQKQLGLLSGTPDLDPPSASVYVAWGGGNDTAGCGLSPASPCNTLQYAIDSAGDGSTIFVAPGRYVGVGNRMIDFRGKSLTIQGLPIPELPSVYPEVCPPLDVEDSRSSAGRSGIEGVVIDCEGKGPAFVLRTKFETLVKSTCRAYADARRPGGSQDTSDRNHLLGIHETESQEDACREDLVALVTMTMANCNSPSNGGALLVEAPVMSRVLVKDCVFVNNSARGFGGAVAVKGRDVTFEGCLFRNNSGGAGGGGVAIGGGPRQEDRASVTFTRCCWGNNTAVMGGAFHVTEGRVQIVDSNVEGNHAVRLGGAGFVGGGHVSLVRSRILGNQADVFSASVHVDPDSGPDSLDVVDSLVQDNVSPPHPLVVHQLREHGSGWAVGERERV